MKRILYAEHAIERIYERGISDRQVESTVLKPDLREEGQHGRLEAVKRFGRRKLRVVYKDLPSMHLVITAYYD